MIKKAQSQREGWKDGLKNWVGKHCFPVYAETGQKSRKSDGLGKQKQVQ